MTNGVVLALLGGRSASWFWGWRSPAGGNDWLLGRLDRGAVPLLWHLPRASSADGDTPPSHEVERVLHVAALDVTCEGFSRITTFE